MPESKMPVFVRRLGGPVFLLGTVVLAVLVARAFGLAAPTMWGANSWAGFAVGVGIAVVVVRLLDYLLFDVVFRLRRQAVAPALLRQLVSLVLLGIAVSIVVKMHFPGVQLGTLLTTSAIITAVIGLALQDTLGNLFAGLALHLEKTMRVGDMVRAGETFGTVEELSWRAIKLRTTEGHLLLIPNSVAGRERIEIYPRPGPPIARFLRVGLEYEVSPAVAREALESALRGLSGIAAHPSGRAYVKSFEGYNIIYELRYWLEDFGTYLETDSLVRERVWYALHRAGLQIPMPLIRQFQYAGGPVPPAIRGASIGPALSELDLFAPLTDEERAQIGEGAIERRYAPGEIIVREGDRTSSMFVVAAGRAGVSKHGPTGDTRNLATLESGTAFGEISLLTGEPRTATVRALTETVLVEIDKATLEPVLRGNPALCTALQSVLEKRRRDTATLVEASHEELAAPRDRALLADRIARFFGIGS